jgi:WD40 repeat protein
MTTLFVSDGRGDDEPFVERLYQDLSARGFEVWWDRQSMPGRALTFLQEIRDAITARDRFVLVVGPKAVTSDYVRAEWLYALEIGKAINPVLRLGDYDLLPDELKLLDTPDFRNDGRYAARLETLLRQLSEHVAPMGKLIAVPSLPPHFLRRPDRLRALKDAVLADLHRPVVITGTVARTGIHGMGGIGKSVLASALARDHEVRRGFPDGVFWVGIGQQPTLVTLQRRVAQALGDSGHFDSEPQGKGKLHELLEHKAVLFVLDDVWDAAHAEAFDVLGPRCRAVITTRDAALITALGGTSHQVQLLTEAEALTLLAQWAECPEHSLPHFAHEVMAECDRLPLALSICGAMNRDGTSWSDILAALREADLEYLDHPHGNILKSIKVSIDALAPDQARRFAELAVFPPDETVPERAVATLWSHTGPMKEREARRLLTVLERRALVRLDYETPEPGDDPKRRVSLHNLLYDHATRLAGDRVALNEQLLDAYSRQCPEGWPSGPNDGYFFQKLRHHLAESGRDTELTSLLRDLRWLEAKTEAGLVFDLAMDFTRVVDSLPPMHPALRHLHLLERALRVVDISIIARHRTILFQCLWNQGWWYDSPDAAVHYDPLPPDGLPWELPAPERLSTLLESWRLVKEQHTPSFVWVQSLRPEPIPLGTSLLAVIHVHGDTVSSVAFAPDGRRIATGSWDGTVRIWDAQTGAELARIEGFDDVVTSVSYSSDGRSIVGGSRDGTVRICDARTGVGLNRLDGHTDQVTSVAYSPDGRRIVSGSNDRTVRVWDATTGAELARLEGHEETVESVAFGLDGRCVVSGSWDLTIRIWDAQTGAELARLEGHDNVVSSVAFNPTTKRFASGSWDLTVRIWDAQTGAELARLEGHDDVVSSVAFEPAGERVVSGSWDNTVRVWDAQTGVELARFEGHDGGVKSVAFDPGGRRIASGSDDSTVRVWDTDARGELTRIAGHGNGITSVAFDSDGRRVVSGSWDKTVRVWDAATCAPLACHRGHESAVRSVAFDPTGGRIVSASGDYFLPESVDCTVRIWDAQTGVELTRLEGHDDVVFSAAYSPDGRRIVSGSSDQTVRVWDAASGLELVCLRGHSGAVKCVAYSPDGRRIISGSSDNTVRVWDAESHAKLTCLRGHEYPVTNVAYSPDGRRIVSGSYDTVRVWDATSGECLEVIQGFGDVASIAAGGAAFPWRAMRLDLETVIVPAGGGEAVAWFPAMNDITTHLSGRIWAGSWGNHLYLIRLEGEPIPKPPVRASC